MDYRDKIRKLLALSESNNEHEARAALLKARELMAQHKISELDIIDVKKKKVKRVRSKYQYAKRGEYWIGSLAQIIAENYCCRMAAERSYGKQKLGVIFVGLDGDVDLCNTIFEYAVGVARDLSDVYLKEKSKGYRLTHAEKNKVKNSYAYGFAKGVSVAFENQKEHDETGWGLIMLTPQEVVEACSDFQTDRYVSRHSIFSDVRNDGYNEGTKFNPNEKLGCA